MNTPLRIAAAIAVLLVSTAAEARPRHHRVAKIASVTASVCVSDNNARTTCNGPIAGPPMGRKHIAPSNGWSMAGIVGGRPAGCPHRYCGCGVSLKVFGRIIPELNLAANWLRKFPPASPASGMVAARSGHVFYIQSVNGDGTVVAYDPNSGGGLTRIHTVSLNRYRVVNPHASRMASN